jgi:ribosomal protein S18 acetylase RimI-like enzyme
MPFAIRPYHPSDLYAYYRVCLLTGDNGSDASALYQDPELLGHIYAAPYATFEPELCFTLTEDGKPCGYVLGTRDSAAFSARCEQDWFPVLRTRYPLPDPEDTSPDADLIRSIHAGSHAHPDLSAYPAHLHIDLLPTVQGHGLGRKLIATLLNQLRGLGVPAVHLGVSAGNLRAIGFYERVGFHRIKAYEGWVAYGISLKG